MLAHFLKTNSRVRLVMVALVMSFLFAGLASAQPARFVEGQNYKQIPNPVSYEGDQVPVVEFFLYTCPHCYHLDPSIEKWRKQLADDVHFERVPVLFGPQGEFYARMYYAEQKLGVIDDLHSKIFTAIHEKGKRLDTMHAAKQFFENYGISGDAFEKAFNSKQVDQKIQRAKKLMKAFQIQAVPTFGVAGRYFISGNMAGSNEAMLDVADYLIKKTK